MYKIKWRFCDIVYNYTFRLNSSNVKNLNPTLTQRALELAKETLQIEADAILTLKKRLSDDSEHLFAHAVHILLGCQGRVVVSGIGKSGHIARKIASTLSSTGTPAMFVHPAEASHGDLGMIRAEDVFISISNSGQAEELLSIVPIIKRMGAKHIALTGNPDSELANLADIHLSIQVSQEACPLNLAPTASTTVTLAMGDALAVALLDARGFQAEDFAKSHPGGALGRRLLTHVSDIMRTGNAMATILDNASLLTALLEISKKGLGMTAVVDQNNRVVGIFTDGDLRRLIEHTQDFSSLMITDVMNPDPHTIYPERLAAEAVEIMEKFRVNQLLVIDHDQKLLGELHIHDLTQAKII
jgi:arabinose-5-phosphate isomerase